MSVIALHTPSVHRSEPARRCGGGGLVSVWAARHRHRRMLRDDLLLQPDSVLADAGITRRAATCEAHKPFWRA